MRHTFTLLIAALALSLAGCATTTAQVPLWKTLPPPAPPLPPADTSGFAAVNGIQMYYAVFNESGGDPVILLHGGLGSSDDWGFEVPLLARTHEVIVTDARGRGRSTRSDQPLTYELMTSDVLALMDALEIRKASVVGWSDGGIIGLLLAIHHPERINKLFTFGTNFDRSGYSDAPPDTTLSAQYMARVEADYLKLSPAPDEFPSLLRALGQMYQAEPNLTAAELGMIQAPTVIAAGQYEQFITREHTETLAHLIPGAKLVIIPNVSHGGPLQDPARFHEAVAGLLDGGK